MMIAERVIYEVFAVIAQDEILFQTFMQSRKGLLFNVQVLRKNKRNHLFSLLFLSIRVTIRENFTLFKVNHMMRK